MELKNDHQNQQVPLFTTSTLTLSNLERQRRADFINLLEAWAQTAASSPAVSYGLDVPTVVANAKAALGRNLTVYEALLLHVAPAFLGPDDRELEVLELGADHD